MSEIIQRSPEWIAERLGKVTASRVADVIAKTKSGPSTSRQNYMAELVAERLTGVPTEKFTSPAMQWGTDTEAQARAAYAFYAEVDVKEVGFIEHPRIPMTGASPDGLVSHDGSTELKCPGTATHIGTLLGDPIPAKYITQMQWQMVCSERAWCDFVSYDPRLPGSMQIFVQRVPRNPEMISALEKEVVDFLAELEVKVRSLRERYERKAA